MIEEGAVNQTSERIAFHADMGYRCYDLDRSSTHLVVTVSHFFPEWCTCLAGWHGSGINCEECDENTFNPNESALTCAQCPANTTSGRRKKSVHDCQCKAGALHEVDGEWICGCPKGKARDNDSCLPCQDSCPKRPCPKNIRKTSNCQCYFPTPEPVFVVLTFNMF